MSEGSLDAGDVSWALDPYSAAGPRPWLVLAAGGLPFTGGEYICAALTLSDQEANLAVGQDWVVGGNPDRTSYCSPWVLATVKHDAVANPQGSVTNGFTERVVREAAQYVAGDVGLELGL